MSNVASMIRSDALYCERVVRSHARTFTLATYFLPPQKRRASFAFYCFAKAVSELAQSPGRDRKSAARRVQGYRRELSEALDGRPKGAILREVRWAMRVFDVDAVLLFELLDGMARDASVAHYSSWRDLECWSEQVGTTIGTMCARVLGIPGGAKQQQIALAHARTLGVAMQLTTILRDTPAHARQGRCFLPEEELRRFSLSRDEVISNIDLTRDPRWQRLMLFEIGRARTLYERSLPGISMLAEDSQRCAAACAIGYAAVLEALEQSIHDSSRASLGTIARLGIIWEAWRYRGRASA